MKQATPNLKNNGSSMVAIVGIISVTLVIFVLIGVYFFAGRQNADVKINEVQQHAKVTSNVVHNNNCEQGDKIYFSIPELRIKFLVDKTIKNDLVYRIDGNVVSFTSKTLLAINKESCNLQDGASPLGSMEILDSKGYNSYKKADLQNGILVKKEGGMFLIFYPSGTPCCDFNVQKCKEYNYTPFYIFDRQDKECVIFS